MDSGAKKVSESYTEKDEHRTSNAQHRMMNKKTNVEQRMVIEEKDDEASLPEGLKRKRNSHSRFEIGFLKTNEIKLRSGATSLFDVQHWTFDVRCSVHL